MNELTGQLSDNYAGCYMNDTCLLCMQLTELSNQYTISSGIKQGGSLSPTLSSIY